MEQLKKDILDSRNLKPRSIQAYIFNLEKLHDKMFGNKNITSLEYLKDTKKVMGIIDDLKLSTRKTYLASIVVALSTKEKKYEKELKIYRDEMMDLIGKSKDEAEKQEKSTTQAENWTSMAELKKVIKKYKKDLQDRGTFKKNKEDINPREKALLQKWMVGSLYVLDDKHPPLRNDFTPMKIISYKQYTDLTDEEKGENNYLVIQSRNKKFFSLGEYKTSQTYGVKRIDLTSKLNSVINIYQKYNDGDYLIYNAKNQPMSPNGLTKYLNKIFEPSGKNNISSTMLRHIYISEKFGGPTLKEKKEVAEKMGHSVSTQEIYKKQ